MQNIQRFMCDIGLLPKKNVSIPFSLFLALMISSICVLTVVADFSRLGKLSAHMIICRKLTLKPTFSSHIDDGRPDSRGYYYYYYSQSQTLYRAMSPKVYFRCISMYFCQYFNVFWYICLYFGVFVCILGVFGCILGVFVCVLLFLTSFVVYLFVLADLLTVCRTVRHYGE
jgi:hypothetical protein